MTSMIMRVENLITTDEDGHLRVRYNSDSRVELEPCSVRIDHGQVYLSHPSFGRGQWMQFVKDPE